MYLYILLLMYVMQMSSLAKIFLLFVPLGYSALTGIPWQIKFQQLTMVPPWLSVPSLPVGLWSYCRVSKMDKVEGVPMPQLLHFTSWQFKLILQTWTGAPEVWAHIPAAGGGDYISNCCKQVYEIVSVRVITVVLDESHCLHRQATSNLPGYCLCPALEAITHGRYCSTSSM